ncbi:very short patch repair endonuclease [Saccharibacillus qingshengii]|uniref:very short patch repair endonuclease n=1 Tax=Saccharibacillus qingshengii TaxID=1763540 RepID=UPI00155824AD|nr:very short patch repair endonuclease [Saccharibacillus qingshengii]
MADRFSKEVRSKVMKSVRSKTKFEDRVFSELWRQGVRFRRNVNGLEGKPDLAIKKYKVVIFLDSCFWHVCPIHKSFPKSNEEFWVKKLQKNVERDKVVTEFYLKKGWNILRVWEHEIKTDFRGSIDQMIVFIDEAKKQYSNKS